MTFVPLATYRIQFHSGFGFQAASAVLEYLHHLGISDVYASPIFQARSGSTHGYDVVDPARINPELGSSRSFSELRKRIKRLEMGWIQDIVPNHMAFHPENNRLMDVLEKGPSSAYHSYFDIDWDHPYPGLNGRVLAPFLGELYGEALDGGELVLKYSNGRLTVHYYDLSFPLKIESMAAVFQHNLEDLKRKLGEGHRDTIRFLGVLELLGSLKSRKKNQSQMKQLHMIKEMIEELYQENKTVRDHINNSLKDFNQAESSTVPYKALNDLLNQQYFRLSFWKTAMEEINYRRFFNINDLISVRMEVHGVFDDSHKLIKKYIDENFFSGLRVDHIDGLYHPGNYLRRLRRMAGNRYILVEKILDADEHLPDFFPVEGTTGYDWMNKVNGIFCAQDEEARIEKFYRRFTGLERSYSELAADKKRLIIGKNMAGDIDNLARRLKHIAEKHRSGQDFTMYGLKRALVEILARFSVYRSYNTSGSVRDCDREVVRNAVQNAGRFIPEMVHECLFIQQCLLMDWDESWDKEMQCAGEEFSLKFQQYSGPVMAKGFEDTLLYVYNPLISLNEVGGNPNRFGMDLSAFHAWNRERQKEQPFALNASATHDNKRGEDVRARINVLSEMPEAWDAKVKGWHKLNLPFKSRTKQGIAPDANDEYFLYQTLLGTYPFKAGEHSRYRERMKEYLIKAVREAKIHTAWLRPDQDYEQAFLDYFKGIIRPNSPFMKDFIPFQRRIAYYGIFNSLSQVVLKVLLPGIPDFYQGCEFWDLSLVDPDNRRPVDYDSRRESLQEVMSHKDRPGFLRQLWRNREDGLIKMFLIWITLRIRRDYRKVFEKGEYLPATVAGPRKNSIIAFMRTFKEQRILVAVPRMLTGVVNENQTLGQADWLNTRIILPGDEMGGWVNLVTGQSENLRMEVPAEEAFASFPAALFGSENRSQDERIREAS